MAAVSAELSALLRSRELLGNLVAKELKVRYKGSALGFVWSLVTPLLLTAVFTVVFATFIKIELPGARGEFATFFLSGYLVWQFFSNSTISSTTAIVGNGALIKKVWFPREVLPLSLVLSQAVHLGLALVATSPLIVYQRGFHPASMLTVAVGLVLVVAFTAGVSMIFAAANVGFRDLQELTQVMFLAWFYLTPVIYPLSFVEANAPAFLPFIRANPMTWFVELFHTAIFGSTSGTEGGPPAIPEPLTFAVCALWAGGALALGSLLFRRLAGSFAKEV